MPTFGICGPLTIAADAKAAGWDYVEGSIQTLFQGDVADEDWNGEAQIHACPLPVPAANVLLPGDLKIVGPSVDETRLARYIERVMRRAGGSGTTTLVFGSGVARGVPEGFDRGRARDQIVKFATACGLAASKHGVALVFEPLNRGECNILNGVAEAMEYVRAINLPSVRCLVDSYHSWLEKEPLSDIVAAMPAIAHVHVADEEGRETPGVTGKSDYRAFFGVLKQNGYDGRISVESPQFKPEQYGSALAFLKREWAAV